MAELHYDPNCKNKLCKQGVLHLKSGRTKLCKHCSSYTTKPLPITDDVLSAIIHHAIKAAITPDSDSKYDHLIALVFLAQGNIPGYEMHCKNTRIKSINLKL
jgi:hypothetical protein